MLPFFRPRPSSNCCHLLLGRGLLLLVYHLLAGVRSSPALPIGVEVLHLLGVVGDADGVEVKLHLAMCNSLRLYNLSQ